MPTDGNQCALILERYAPCYLEVDGHRPEIEECKFQGTGRHIQMQDWKTVEKKETGPCEP